MTVNVFNMPEGAAKTVDLAQVIGRVFGFTPEADHGEPLTMDEAMKIKDLLTQIKGFGGFTSEDLSNVHSLDDLANCILGKMGILRRDERKAFNGFLRYNVMDFLKLLIDFLCQIQASRRACNGEMPAVPEIPEDEKMTKVDIAAEYGISEDVITMLRAKRFLPDPYVQKGNVIYWLRADITPYLEAIQARSK